MHIIWFCKWRIVPFFFCNISSNLWGFNLYLHVMFDFRWSLWCQFNFGLYWLKGNWFHINSIKFWNTFVALLVYVGYCLIQVFQIRVYVFNGLNDQCLFSAGDLLMLLNVASDSTVLPTTYGELRPPLGKHRLKVWSKSCSSTTATLLFNI